MGYHEPWGLGQTWVRYIIEIGLSGGNFVSLPKEGLELSLEFKRVMIVLRINKGHWSFLKSKGDVGQSVSQSVGIQAYFMYRYQQFLYNLWSHQLIMQYVKVLSRVRLWLSSGTILFSYKLPIYQVILQNFFWVY